MKGKKKQWNKSESAQTVHDYLIDEAEQVGQQARPDDTLFFIDTGKSVLELCPIKWGEKL
jgi:hypothetical protein